MKEKLQQEEVLFLVELGPGAVLEVGLVEEQKGFEQHLWLLEFECLYAGEVEVRPRRVLSSLEYNERNRVISYIHPACVHLCVCMCVCVCTSKWPLPIGTFQDQWKQTMINKYSNKQN